MARDEKGREKALERVVEVEVDVLNEQIVVAAALVDGAARAKLLRDVPPDRFRAKEHRVAWTALGEMERRKLAYDPATLLRFTNGELPAEYLAGLVERRPELPTNLGFHVGQLLWDHSRLAAVDGPISALLEALRDVRTEPERVRALAQAVGKAFDGHEQRHLLDGGELVRAQIAEIRARADGVAVYPFGIRELDLYEADHESKPSHPRLIPGVEPGAVTVVTGLSGAGKTTVTANLVLGLARQKRRVLYGAWEVKGGMTLEILAGISLKWSRKWLRLGRCAEVGAPTDEGGIPEKLDSSRLDQLAVRMSAIAKHVRFLANPFKRRAGQAKPSNEANLDLIENAIRDAGADVFVADLWERCLAYDKDESDLRQALFRQQAIAQETRCHCILLAQQKLKEVETRADKRPTREGIKGSSAWVDIADTILGVHRPSMFKAMDDDVLEIDILKQRYGLWPEAIEFDWNGERAQISNGRTVPYTQPLETSDGAEFGDFKRPKKRR